MGKQPLETPPAASSSHGEPSPNVSLSNIRLSLVIPTLNEVDHIDKLISELPFDDTAVEILFVDGGSTDGTCEKVKHYADMNRRVSLVNNPRRYVNFGFNEAFPRTKGQYIGLLGAHAIYPKQFCAVAIDHLDRGEADVVAGPLRQVGRGCRGKAIAYCMSSRFGVGQTDFRTSKAKKYVDTAAFAVYKREVFDRVGLLDEQLIRNQDDELHYRICQHGYRILMVPEMEVTYFVRESLRHLWLQYFRYGYYKPLVHRKVRSGIRLKHLIPPCFVLYLLSLAIAFVWPIWGTGLFVYLCLVAFFSWRCPEPPAVRAMCLAVFPLLHVAYGAGYLCGLQHRV